MKKNIYLIIIGLLLLISFGNIVKGQDRGYQDILREGNIFFKNGQYDSALLKFIALNSVADKPINNVFETKVNTTVKKWVAELDSLNKDLDSAFKEIFILFNRSEFLLKLLKQSYKKRKTIEVGAFVAPLIEEGKPDDAFSAAHYAYKTFLDSIQNDTTPIPLSIKRALGDAVFAKFHKEIQTGHQDIMKVVSGNREEFSLIGRDSSLSRWPDYRWENTAWEKGKEIALGTKKKKDFILSASYSDEGDQLIFTTKNQWAYTWDLKSDLSDSLGKHKEAVLKGAFLTDGKRLTISRDGMAIIWNKEENNAEELKIGNFPITDFILLNDKETIIFKSFRKVLILNINTLEKIKTLDHNGAIIYSIDISPDQKYILTTSSDKLIKIWDIEGEEQIVLRHDTPVYTGVFSANPTKKTILSGTQNGKSWLWDFENHGSIISIAQDTNLVIVTDAAFSEDGSLSVTWGENVFHLPSLNKTINHKGKINSIRFSSDNQYFLTSSDDGTAKLWSLDGEVLMNMELGSPVKDAFFSSLKDKIIAITKNGKIFMCPFPDVVLNELSTRPPMSPELDEKIRELFPK